MQRNIQVEQTPCPLCKKVATKQIASGVDREYYTSRDMYHVVECDTCKLLYLNPRPTKEELGNIYPQNYHSYIIDTEPKKISFLTKMRYKAHTSRFAKILKYIKADKKIDLLDVGCGDGWMMHLFKQAAPDRINTFGVEISPEVCDFARSMGNTVYCGRIEDVHFDRQFDLLNYNHVIEHVSDPYAVTLKSYQVLKPGGILVYETPNADTIDRNWFHDSNWGAYHFPRHWYFFTPDSLRRMGESAGLEYVAHYFHPGPTHWVWTLHNVAMKYNNFLGRFGQWLFDPVKIFRKGIIPFTLLGFFTIFDSILIKLTGRSSVMTIIFRKPETTNSSS
jgi:2-polyprenyl-3-methyl-5-hydroxy-6-metoxy-1,4-benzoquinol methylase